jgi:ferredoxin-NADP reductase
MNTVKIKLIKKVEEARSTESFFWEPEKPIKYLPGQYFYFTVPSLKYPDPRGTTRHFTLSSSPTEGNTLMSTTRIRAESGYKRTLSELPEGTVIDGEGPNGVFVFDENEQITSVFLAGGIGITPFRSMIKYVADKNLLTPIYLIYSNSDPDFVFKKELEKLAAAHPNIKIHYVVTSVEGHLDQTKIEKILQEWQLENGKLTWWVCGPPVMIDAMEQTLGELGVTTNHLRTEKLTGY